jgi:hypothetical protein
MVAKLSFTNSLGIHKIFQAVLQKSELANVILRQFIKDK